MIDSTPEMLNFLKNSSSLYHQLCYWFKTHAFAQKKERNYEIHHIIPKYLKTFDSDLKLEKRFNMIAIPFEIHFLLHAIRFVEFQYNEDYQSISITTRKLSSVNRNQIGKMKDDPCFCINEV